MRNFYPIFIVAALFLNSCTRSSQKNYLNEAVQAQRQDTKVAKLKNGIPVIIRNERKSDIVSLMVGWSVGQKDVAADQRVLGKWAFESMPFGSKAYPKEKVFGTIEKYSLQMGCDQGIETSKCSIGTLNEYWDESVALLADIIKNPVFDATDVNIVKMQLNARFESVPNNPEGYVNEVVNKVFYGPNHPYLLTYQDAIKQLEQLKPADLAPFHKKLLDASLMTLVVVSSLPEEKIIADLNKQFGDLPSLQPSPSVVNMPTFDKSNALVFEHRDIPTAYIRMKFTAPSRTSSDAVASKLLFRILDEELGDEIRTKRSLSYAVYSFTMQYQMGIGTIAASTSKPQQTLEAIEQVIEKIKSKKMSNEELEENKKAFTTQYFLGQETHESIAASLWETYRYYRSLDPYFSFPGDIEKVTADDVQRLAKSVLNNMRIGVIYHKDKFQQDWAKKFIDSTVKM